MCICDRYIKMSSPNMNNVILLGAILTFTSIIFGGTDSSLLDDTAHLIMCKVIEGILLSRAVMNE